MTEQNKELTSLENEYFKMYFKNETHLSNITNTLN